VAGTILENPSDGLTTVQRNNKRGLELTNNIRSRFFDKENATVYEYYPYKDDSSEVASVWHYNAMFSLVTRMLTLNPDNKDLKSKLVTLTEDFEYYKERRSDYRVYAVERGFISGSAATGPNTNVYDDNEWITREFLNAYEVTKDEEYLNKAKDVCKYVLSGWDSTINSETNEEWGGIYWGPYYTCKNTCSNAPLVSSLVRLYEITNDSSYLDWAKKVYKFSYDTFRMDDALYGDMIGTYQDDNKQTIRHGGLDTTKYSYNSGTMISAGAYLYKVTKEEHYLNEAKETAQAAFEYFGNGTIVDGVYQFPVSTTLWFNMQLFQGFFDLYQQDKTQKTYLDNVQKSVDFAYNNYLYDGSLPCNWIVGWMYGIDKDQYKNVMDETANAETFALLGQYSSIGE